MCNPTKCALLMPISGYGSTMACFPCATSNIGFSLSTEELVPRTAGPAAITDFATPHSEYSVGCENICGTDTKTPLFRARETTSMERRESPPKLKKFEVGSMVFGLTRSTSTNTSSKARGTGLSKKSSTSRASLWRLPLVSSSRSTLWTTGSLLRSTLPFAFSGISSRDMK